LGVPHPATVILISWWRANLSIALWGSQANLKFV
jgi:hypothetical protein